MIAKSCRWFLPRFATQNMYNIELIISYKTAPSSISILSNGNTLVRNLQVFLDSFISLTLSLHPLCSPFCCVDSGLPTHFWAQLVSFVPDLPPSVWFSWIPLMYFLKHVLHFELLLIWSLVLFWDLANQCLPFYVPWAPYSSEFNIASCWLSPWWLCDVPQCRFSFLFLAWHLMCTFNLRRHCLYSIWRNSQLSPFPILLVCHPVNSLLLVCSWVCTEGPHPLCVRAALTILSLCDAL